MRKQGIIFCDKPDCREPDRIIHPKDPGLRDKGAIPNEKRRAS